MKPTANGVTALRSHVCIWIASEALCLGQLVLCIVWDKDTELKCEN